MMIPLITIRRISWTRTRDCFFRIAYVPLGIAIFLSGGCEKKVRDEGGKEAHSKTNHSTPNRRDPDLSDRVKKNSSSALPTNLDDLKKNSGDRHNYTKLLKLLPELSPVELREAFEVATAVLSHSDALSVKHQIFNLLARKDPEAGWGLLETVSAGTDRQSLIGSFFGSLSFESACSFIDRLEDLPFPEDNRLAKAGIATALNRADLSDLYQLLTKSENRSPVFKELVGKAYGRSAAVTGLGFDQLVKSIDSSGSAGQIIIETWAVNRSILAPKEFASELIALPLTGKQQETLLPTAVANLAVQDPKAAVIFSSGLGNAPGSRNSMAVAMGYWIRSDSLQASQWLSQQQPSYLRDVAAVQVVHHLSRQNSGGEISGWIEFISDPDLKKDAERQAAFHRQNNQK